MNCVLIFQGLGSWIAQDSVVLKAVSLGKTGLLQSSAGPQLGIGIDLLRDFIEYYDSMSVIKGWG